MQKPMNPRRCLQLGLIGNGGQMRGHHLPYLAWRRAQADDINIRWASGCMCSSEERKNCRFETGTVLRGDACLPLGYQRTCGDGADDWRRKLDETPAVDAVIISIPNALHAERIRAALERGIAVAVDKPPVLSARECQELVDLARQKDTVFWTLAQRRFEDVFQLMGQQMRAENLGEVRLINYLFVHGWRPQTDNWRGQRSLAGGGVVMDSVYHGLDVLWWMLRLAPHSETLKPVMVQARWRMDERAKKDAVETEAALTVEFNSGLLLNVTAASTGISRDSVDENIKIFGECGVLRYMRDQRRTGMAAGELTFQDAKQLNTLLEAGRGQARREAPLEGFLDALRGNPVETTSPASDSVAVLAMIEAAYASAAAGGKPMSVEIP